MNNTSIEWTEKTWNPMHGCTKVSEGCRNCYAETMARRLKGAKVFGYEEGFKVRLCHERVTEPAYVEKPTMFFVCSMGDLFHKDVPVEFIDRVMDIIEICPQHTFQILTKRPDRMYDYFINYRPYKDKDMPKNCWFGVTVEHSDTKDRIDYLRHLETASVRFLSCEPLISDLGVLNLSNIDWVIVGGESGNQARPMKKEWVLNIKRQCEEQGVPFFFKQWGTYGEDGIKRNKKANGHTIDGQVYQAWPKSHTHSL